MGKMLTPASRAAMEEAGSKLTAKQRAFVDNLFLPNVTQTEAAVKAGYAEGVAHVTASRTLKLPHVQEYLKTCVQEGIAVSAVKAIGVVDDLQDTAKSDYVKLQAAQDVLDRAGYKPVEKHAHAVRGELVVNIDLS